MVRVEHLVFGYYKISVNDGSLGKLATLLLRLSIPATMSGEYFVIRARDFATFKAHADGRIRYSASGPFGLPGVLLRQKRRLPVVITALVALVLTIFLSTLIWDIRIVTEDTVDSDAIIATLSDNGFSVGSSWGSVDKESVEVALLSGLPEISWVSINRRGTVAYVEVRRSHAALPPSPEDYVASNIVASCDGVIEEINVSRGRAMVKVGDVVKKGDILISGVIDTERDTVITNAEGNVRASVGGSTSVDAPFRVEHVEQVPSRICAIVVKILGFNINIFKNYGNLPQQYDIIEEKWGITLTGDRTLPFSVNTERLATPVTMVEDYNELEVVSLAEEYLLAQLEATCGEGNLIRLNTRGEYHEWGYRLYADYTLSVDIGRVVPIDITN